MSGARTHREDRGLAAVLRVREVRETDSRLGMRVAIDEERAAVAQHSALVDSLGAAQVPVVATPTELAALHTGLGHLGDQMVLARAAELQAGAIAADARARWSADRARLSAVERLLLKRAERRRTEAERRAAKDADDIATQRWLRDRAQGGAR